VRVLVTGAAGFVGQHLVARLARAGCEVAATDRELDVADGAAVAAALARLRPDAVVHLAAQSSVALSRRDPALTYRVNYRGTLALLEAAREHAPDARLLVVGSADVYGPGSPGAAPFREDSPLRPTSPYACSKAAADLLAAGFARRGLDVVRARTVSHAGPGQREDFALASFARQLVEMELGRREPVLRVGNLDSVRDVLDVRDVVEAYWRLLDRRVPAGAYNVASGRGAPLRVHLEGLLGLARVRPRIQVDPERLRPLDVSVADPSRLRGATGWAPRVDLRETLASLLAFWRAELSGS
jgi:GDP-4-dehydro-6-deoxy-D-mannose reductase